MSSSSPASQVEATEALRALFTAFPSDKGPVNGFAATFLIAVEGYSQPAIRKAVTRLIRGEFDWFDGRFLPTPAQVSRACRFCEDLIAPVKRLALPAPEDTARTEEEMERRRAMAERVKAQWGVPGVRRDPVPTPAEEFDAWEKRELERLAIEGLPKLSPHLVDEAKAKLEDARRVADALIAAEKNAEERRQRLAKQDTFAKPTPTVHRNEEAA